MKKCILGLVAAALVIVGTPAVTMAGPITGTELNPLVGWTNTSGVPLSTNAQNYANGTQYVLFVESAPGTITLEFHNNLAPSFGAWFEYRIDGVAVPGPLHPYNPNIAALGDVLYPFVSSGPAPYLTTFHRTFTANDMVEIRMSFGPERNYYFNWTAFENESAVPDAGGTLALLGLAMIGIGAVRRWHS